MVDTYEVEDKKKVTKPERGYVLFYEEKVTIVANGTPTPPTYTFAKNIEEAFLRKVELKLKGIDVIKIYQEVELKVSLT